MVFRFAGTDVIYEAAEIDIEFVKILPRGR